jgi:hypothetical protein
MERTSSHDLLLEQLGELIRDRQRDLSDGLTLRSLQRRLEEHSAFDKQEFDKFEERLREVEQRTAAHTAMDTGRYQIPPTTINLEQPKHSHRPSTPPWIKVAAKSPVVHWLGVVLIVAAGHLLTRCGFQMPPPPAQSTH